MTASVCPTFSHKWDEKMSL